MSSVIVPFLYELRKRQLKVGTQEVVQLARAMSLGLHNSTLDGFYYTARALMVHKEADLDRFDEAFLAHFRGIQTESKDLLADLEEWLKDPKVLESLTPEQIEAMQDLDIEALQELFAKRLEEQKKRHEGGNKWIGTGGTSPFGTSGKNPNGMSIKTGNKGQRGGSALGMADARKYRGYRSDVVLDVRQIEVALRKLRQFTRDGFEEELDVEASIDATARAFGELEIVMRPPKKSNVRVLLLMDVGGSMEPFAHTCSQLFSAAKRASNFRELKTFYFHNAIYGKVFSSERMMDPMSVPEMLDTVNRRWKLVMVGDAAMAPGELLSAGPWSSASRSATGRPMTGFDWLAYLADEFDRHVWLNPDPPQYWQGGTCEVIRQVYPMHHLSVEGLSDAVTHLSRISVSRKPALDVARMHQVI